MFSRCEKYIAAQRGNWQHSDRQDGAGYFWYEFKVIQTMNTVLWLFNDITASDKGACELIVFLYLLKAQNEHEWTSERILF